MQAKRVQLEITVDNRSSMISFDSRFIGLTPLNNAASIYEVEYVIPFGQRINV